MLSVLLVIALAGQARAPSPDIKVIVQSTGVVVTVQPPARRSVKTIVVRPHTGQRKTIRARSTDTLPKGGVRAVFDNPYAGFDVVVTLDDGSSHRADTPPVYTIERPYQRDVLPPRPYARVAQYVPLRATPSFKR